jgi:hypothetical protein
VVRRTRWGLGRSSRSSRCRRRHASRWRPRRPDGIRLLTQLRGELGDVAQPAAELSSVHHLESEAVVAGLQVMREPPDTELASTSLEPPRLFAELVDLDGRPRPGSAEDPPPSDQKRQRLAHQYSRIRGWLAHRDLPIDRLRHQTSWLSQRGAEDTSPENESGWRRRAERRISSSSPRCLRARSIPRGFWRGTADDSLRRSRTPEPAGSPW